MDNLEQRLNEYRAKKEQERQKFFKKCSEKVRDGEFIYRMLSLYIAKRYDIDTDFQLPDPIYIILNHYVENVDEDIEEWLHKDNAPLLRNGNEIKKIFPEIAEITKNNRKIVEIANQLYGLNLVYYKDMLGIPYLYSLEFDFNSFTPINIKEIKDLKSEIKTLKKYNVDTTDLENKLKEFDLTEEQIESL